MVVENQVEEDAVQVQNVNQILAVETSLGTCDWLKSELPANVWQAIHDLQDEMSQKASEKDLEEISEFMQEGLNAKPIQGNPGVKFQTPMRGNPETYMGLGNQTPSGRESMDSVTMCRMYACVVLGVCPMHVGKWCHSAYL